jgi:hypothetical protein
MTVETLLNQVWATSRIISRAEGPNLRTKYAVLAKGMEEMGELSQEIMISLGQHYKKPGKDGVIGEAIDVIVCMADLIFHENPNLTEQEVQVLLAAKLAKWVEKTDIKNPPKKEIQVATPISKLQKIKIPFDADGKMYGQYIESTNSWQKKPFVDWQDNRIFHATMTYDGVAKGKYSDRYSFIDQNGASFTMVSSDFDKAVLFMVRGVLEGEFQYSRRNQKYGVTFVREVPLGKCTIAH